MADARINELLDQAEHPVLSYEFFPPRDEKGLDRLKHAAERLHATRPDFVTCTWGAGGSSRERSLQVCDLLRGMDFAPVMPHLTCVGASRAHLEEIVDEIHGNGFRNIMALRGDPPRGEREFRPHPEGLAHASDLVELIKARYPDICCGVAGYPESHLEAASPEEDIEYLKVKIAAGADFITTQLFFDNRFYYDFVPRCRQAGIILPIIPGLLPAMSLKQVQRFSSTCGVSFPPALALAMRDVGSQGEPVEKVGINWAARQIEDLLGRGVPGVHLYVLNRSKAAMAPAVKACFDKVRGA
jgi:methylenetetrahydrofolate reductase (NADPH)